MGVYIKGMEMPKSCDTCDFCTGGLDCWISKENVCRDVRRGQRNNDCPISCIPPHGRLGDMDELAKKIEYDRYNHTHTDGLAARHHIAEYGHFLKEITTAPTIIPAEEGE